MITLTSPVKRFPGTVELPDFLTLPQALAWEQARADADTLRADGKTDAELLNAWLVGIKGVVCDWHIDGYSIEPIQLSPRSPVIQLTAWLLEEITRLYYGDDDPND